jgi:hypothetical protein
MRWSVKTAVAGAASAALLLGTGAGPATASTATSTPTTSVVNQAPSNKDPLNLHAGQPGGPLSSQADVGPVVAPAPGAKDATGGKVNPDGVTVSGKICLNGSGDPVKGGNCWWESAVQLWYNMKEGTNENTEIGTIVSEYGSVSNFEDGWTDDDAWWGIAFQLGNQLYGTSSWLTEANALWTYDTTSPAWNSECGGSDIQYSGGAQNDIARATLGELAHALGKTSSANNAAAWIFSYMQGSTETNAASEGLNTNSGSPCTASTQIAELGGQAESWKVDDVSPSPHNGITGTHNSATDQYPDSDYSGVFNELYVVYGL